jgi:hypothetical protein
MLATQQAFLDDLMGLAVREPFERAAVFQPPPQGTVEDRWHIYAHGYLARIVEALGDEFRAVRRVLGPDAFESLVARYLAHCPPRSFDLAQAGDRLPDFLKADLLSRELPFLAELASLERRLAEAFVAADGDPLSWAVLQRMDPAAAANLALTLQPGATVLRSAWPLHDLWACRDLPDEEISIELEGRPSEVLVFRRGGSVRCEPLDAASASLLEQVAAGGVSLSRLAESRQVRDAAAARELLDCFKSLVDRGVFALRPPETRGGEK